MPGSTGGVVQIGLGTFIRFEAAEATNRVALIEERQNPPDWNKIRDYYLSLRHALRRGVRNGNLSGRSLRLFASQQEDLRKRDRYTALADGFAAFQQRYRPGIGAAPAKRSWAGTGLLVTVDPELTMEIKGIRYCTKVYLGSNPLSRRRTVASLRMLQESYVGERLRPAILDCERGLLLRRGNVGAERGAIVLRVTASSFIATWFEVQRGHGSASDWGVS
jgi:hypothetical protein